MKDRPLPKPRWLRISPASNRESRVVAASLRDLDLHTVCREARCPNLFECWRRGTATVLILGEVCTRNCRFCAVTSGVPAKAPDPDEPKRVAAAVARLGLRYVVITSVDRDDLPDGGASHYARTVSAVKNIGHDIRVEVLIPDFSLRKESLALVTAAGPAVVGHNLETVEALTPLVRDRRCTYRGSLEVLKMVKQLALEIPTKSSLMLGLGESEAQVLATLHDLREAGVELLTLGQYLQPTRQHLPVKEYVTPEHFEALAGTAREMGFRHVASGPLVRSSYHADEAECSLPPEN